ncbi:hypothetical protein ACLN6N_02220 [Sphingomonas carotinifaciens]|uniref:hypothetical protein n=1 Tax=Sphingomonas carotinifaciens TaxID=1166323 RepID=UPI0039A2BA0B
MSASQALIEAVDAVWRIPRPGPDNLLSAPRFTALAEICNAEYGGGKPTFALSGALRSPGLPCDLPPALAHLALPPARAAEALADAYQRKAARRLHLCPLDTADELPALAFGSAQVRQYSTEELAGLFDATRLARNFPTRPLKADRLAQFQWLVVEELVQLDHQPERRACPWLYEPLARDFGEIDPHLGKFPPAVEGALAFLLLAPWEQWSTMQEVSWRGFRVPWIHTVSDDLFIRPSPPPSPDTLSLEPHIVTDHWGEDVELERPTTIPLEDEATPELLKFDAAAWQQFEHGRASALFETPIVHFLVRAFLADGMDEVMAHMTAIEAALGLETDHRNKPKTDPRKNLGATKRVMARIAALLGDVQAAADYKDLFEMRSAYVHGRRGLAKVGTTDRVRARSLARRIARALIDVAAQPAQPREVVMGQLLDQGAPML